MPTLEDCTSLLRVLARSATGQDFSVYTTFSTGARRPDDLDGPDEYHVVLVDNGRSAMLGTEFQDMLRCIRCAACMNHCPVYGAVGGHAYGWVYPGPMGAVLTPSLIGVDQAGHLPNASTFCGKCESVCPVRIPLPNLMRHWREREFERHLTPAAMRARPGVLGVLRPPPGAVPPGHARGRGDARAGSDASAAGSAGCRWPAAGPRAATCRRRRATRSSRATRRRSEPGRSDEPRNDADRDPPRPAARSAAAGPGRDAARAAGDASAAFDPRALAPAASRSKSRCSCATWRRNSAASRACRTLDAVPGAVADYLAAQNLPTTCVMAPHPELRAIPWSARPLLTIREGRAEATDLVSVQHAFAAIAETGTLMLPCAPERPTTLNLLADTEIVVLRASRLVGAYEEAWDLLRAELGGMPRNVMLVTGPSRSADIEQTLELGAHGPRQLHVVLIDDRL